MGGSSRRTEILEDLVRDPDLEELESIADQFNIFDVLGIIHVEVRHSKFLAWLLDPAGSHGFGDYFLGMFMKLVASGMEGGPTLLDVDAWNLSDAEVRLEWNHVDILIVSESGGFVCVIENKIHSSEHSGQLSRYRKIVEEAGEFSGFDKLYVYLTVSGEEPSDGAYLPLTYGDVLGLLSHLLERKGDLGPDVLVLIEHYESMLRRYVVEDSEVQKICRRLYRKHRKAFDLVFEYMPDKLSEIYDDLVEIIDADEDMILDDCSKSRIRFVPREMDVVPKKGTRTSTKRMLLFEMKNREDRLALYLIIGPGPDEIRKTLYRMAQKEATLFRESKRKLTDQVFTIYKRRLLTSSDIEDLTGEELRIKLKQKLEDFRKSDMRRIAESVKHCSFGG
jgi:hypothetical protein